MQDGAHPCFLVGPDLAVEEEQDVDVRIQAQLTASVAAERNDEAGAAAGRRLGEQTLKQRVDAVREAAECRASTSALRRRRAQRLARGFHAGKRCRHPLHRGCRQ